MKKVNIFLVRTQYHLVITINTIFDRYKDYDNIVYYLKGRIDQDFHSDVEFIKYIEIKRESFGTNNFATKLLELNPERFFFFQENCSETKFLIYQLAKKNIIISLLQDGTKPYHNYKKKRLAYVILRDTLLDYIQMIKRKSVVPIPLQNHYNYAFLRQVKEVWLTYPDNYNNKTNKKTVQLPDYSLESLDYLKNLFHFDFNCFNSESILYLGQSWKSIYWETEKEIFDYILKKFPEKQIIYKAHPNSEKGQLELYKKYKNVTIITNRIPAELYVLSMRNTIIISAASTSMYAYNEGCKYYYTYKFYNFGKIFSQVDIGNPTSHIKNIDKLDEITF